MNRRNFLKRTVLGVAAVVAVAVADAWVQPLTPLGRAQTALDGDWLDQGAPWGRHGPFIRVNWGPSRRSPKRGYYEAIEDADGPVSQWVDQGHGWDKQTWGGEER